MYNKIVIMTLIIVFNSCQNSKKMKSKKEDIICAIKILSKSTNGYGTIYDCEITDVIKGKLSDKAISMTILESSSKKYKFLDEKLPSTIYYITFLKKNEKSPYPVMPINGFVDSKRNLWIISEIKME